MYHVEKEKEEITPTYTTNHTRATHTASPQAQNVPNTRASTKTSKRHWHRSKHGPRHKPTHTSPSGARLSPLVEEECRGEAVLPRPLAAAAAAAAAFLGFDAS